MDTPYTLDPEKLDADLAREIDATCRLFEEQWRAGREPRIEDCLEDVAAYGRAVLLVELIALECELLSKRGTPPQSADYLARFPGHEQEVARAFSPDQPSSTNQSPSSDHEAPTIARIRRDDLAPTEMPTLAPTRPPREEEAATVALKQSPAEAVTCNLVLGATHTASTARSDHPNKVRYFGDYLLEHELARGGMGVVYKARQVNLNRTVALKMILAGQLASEADVKRFYLEAEAAANLDHPGIVPIYEIGENDGQHYFSMGFVEGQSLAQRLSEGPLAAREAAELIRRVSMAIDYAHHHGVLHRDVKPANILIDQEGNPRVTDFGLAKQVASDSGLTGSGQIMGTPSFMPPEQAGSGRGDIGPTADVYALGATLYALVTGRPPFQAATAMDTVLQVLSAEPVPPRRLNSAVPLDLETICLKCLQKAPAKRYPSAALLAQDLHFFLENRPIKARRSTSGERFLRWCRRNPTVAALCGVTSALMLTLTVVSVIAAVRIDKARQRADQTAASEKLARQRAQERLVRLGIVTGNFLNDAGDYASALLRYSQAWMLDRDDPQTESLHRLRLACVLERGARLEGVCFHSSPVLAASFDPGSGRILTRTEDGQAFLWDLYRSQPIASPLPHDGKVLCAALSPDGKHAVTTGTDVTARLWASSTGQPLGAPLRHPGAVRHAAFSPDGTRLATACTDGTVRFWAVPDAKPLEPALRLDTEVRYVGYSPDGQLVVTVDGQEQARVWDATTGQPRTPTFAHRLTPGAPADRLFQPPLFSPDSTRLLTMDGQTLRLNHAITGVPALPGLAVGSVNQVVFSADGSRILVILRAITSRVYETASGRVLLSLEHPREVQSGSLSADGRYVATSSSTGLIHVRDAQTGKDIITPFRHVSTVTSLAFTPEGNQLVSVSLDGTVRLWSIGLKPFEALPYDDSCGHADRLFMAGRCVSPDGLWEVRLDGTAALRLRRRRGKEIGPSLTHPGPVRKARFAPDGRSLLTADDQNVQVWDAGTGHPRGPLLPLGKPLKWAQFSDDGSRLVLVDAAGTVNVHATDSGRAVLGPMVLDAEFLTERAYLIRRLVTLSPDGRRLAVHIPSRSPADTRIYEVDTGRNYTTVTGVKGLLTSLAFSPDSKRLVSAASDTLARVWDAETGKPLFPAMRHTSFVRCASFAPDGRRVVTLMIEHIRLWDSVTGDALTPPLPHSFGGLADVWMSRDGYRIVALAPSGAARQWELPAFGTAADNVITLVQLLTGQQVDPSDGIAPLEISALLDAPDNYRRAWLSWRGPANDLAAPSSASAGPGFTDALRRARTAAARQFALGHTQAALNPLVILSAADPADTNLALRVAALQAWFGQDKDLTETCTRALAFAESTFDLPTADRTAKMCCLRPSENTTRLESALILARKVVESGKGHNWLPWFEVTLGIAEYRNGHFAEADAALSAAAARGKAIGYVVVASGFFRAMSLYRKGQEDEALKLAAAAASAMRPLPKDEKNPLAGNLGHDDLIVWMAYKEARALMKWEPAPK